MVLEVRYCVFARIMINSIDSGLTIFLVAGVIAGRLAGQPDDIADGIAPDAKIHMWDMQISNGE